MSGCVCRPQRTLCIFCHAASPCIHAAWLSNSLNELLTNQMQCIAHRHVTQALGSWSESCCATNECHSCPPNCNQQGTGQQSASRGTLGRFKCVQSVPQATVLHGPVYQYGMPAFVGAKHHQNQRSNRPRCAIAHARAHRAQCTPAFQFCVGTELPFVLGQRESGGAVGPFIISHNTSQSPSHRHPKSTSCDLVPSAPNHMMYSFEVEVPPVSSTRFR